MSKLRCIVVEDELPARRILEKYIADLSHLELVLCCSNAFEAASVLKEEKIDLIFLDIHLPKLSGINFVKTLSNPPSVIFTTAYPQYAIEGFELDAVDYLLKPFSFERFMKSVNKVETNAKAPMEQVSKEMDYVFIKTDKKIIRLDINELKYVESQSDYIRLVSEKGAIMVLQSLKYMEHLLSGNEFLRCHKSFIINLKYIDRITGNLIKIGDQEIPIGRHYKQDLMEAIEKRIMNK